MAENKTIQLDVETNLVNLKKQLKEAKAEVIKLSHEFGITSEQAIEAAKRAGEIGHHISEANKLIKSFNPEDTLQSTSKALGGVKEGFEVVGNSMKIVGVESQVLESAISKVGVAMELSQNISAIQETAGTFKTFAAFMQQFTIVQKISTAAQWLWNAAMNANPLGVIIVSITAVIAAGYKLITFFQDSAAEEERQTESIKKHTDALKKQELQFKNSAEKLKDYNKYQEDYAKASGKSSSELRKLALKHQEEELALANKNKELAKSTYLREQDILSTLQANGASDEVIEKQKEVVKQARENATKTREAAVQENKDLIQLKRQQIVEIRQEQTDAHNKELEKNKEQAEKNAALAKKNKEKAIQDAKDLDELNKKALEDKAVEFDKFYQEQLKLQNEQVQHEKDIQDLRRSLIKDDRLKELAELQASYQSKFELAKNDAELSKQLGEQLSEDRKKINDKYRKEEEAKDKEAKEKKLKEEYDLRQKRLQMASSAFSVLSDITSLFSAKNEKDARAQFKIQKAFNLASAITNTALAVTGALTAGGNPIKLATGMQFVEAGIAAAAGAVNIAKISATQFGSTNNNKDSNIPNTNNVTQSMTPQFNLVGGNQTSQLLQGLSMQPLKAYVVASDITTAQMLEQKAIKTSVL